METPTLTRQDIPTEPQASSAWIAPNGDFYYVRDCAHNYCAALILGYDPEDEWNADTLLDARGWVHLSGSDIHVYRGRVSQAQRNTLYDVAVAWNAVSPTTYQYMVTQIDELD